MAIWFSLGLLVAGFLAVLLLARLHRASLPVPGKQTVLAAHYLRLGRFAPQAACACGSPKTYGECCRTEDIRLLTDDVIDYLWKPWAQKSYAGRRRSSSLRHRLEDHALPKVQLPEWVEKPARFTFPIEDSVLRDWRPEYLPGDYKDERDDSIL
jgi:hypothetical protein